MAAINDVTDLDRHGEVAVVTLNSPPVNALSKSVREGVFSALQLAQNDNAVRAIIIICEGRTFSAGADITEFGKPDTGISFSDLQTKMDTVDKPIIAAMHGTALGGGLELAMCAHYRVALASTKLGLPEVNLGLIPGMGGTQRLPRLVGVPQALDMITGGTSVSGVEAVGLGLVDQVFDGNLRENALQFANSLLSDRLGIRRTRDLNARVLGVPKEVFSQYRRDHRFRGFEAPEEAIKCVEAATALPFDQGLAFERGIFEERKASPQSAAQRYAFFAERKCSKIPDLSDNLLQKSIQTVGVIGAGTMGAGIAMCFANVGIPVVIVEIKPDSLARGLEAIKGNYSASVKRGRLSPEQAGERLSCITGSTELQMVADCDLVIEAVFERLEIKKDVFSQLDSIVRKDAILASNTSYLDIDEIAAFTSRPDRVLGLHFFSPANVMRLLEIVRGAQTADNVIATAMKLSKTLGKVGVLVRVGHGFVGNRMLAQRTRQAQALVMEGATPWDVDRVLTAFGMPMGPFQMSDLAGLDLGWVKGATRGETLRDRLNELGRKGQKTRAGYYDYDDNRKPSPSPVTEALIRELMAERGTIPRNISDQEILERTLYPMINEGAKILDEGKAIRASDIDVVWLNGYGFPRWRGGPMYHADRIGLPMVIAGLEKYGWAPSRLLVKLAADGAKLAEV